jgi:mono/diheme cytochrome c family protein
MTMGPTGGVVAFFVLLAIAACGDPETDDHRGYTKAPLEHPSVVIRGEEPSDMSRYGEPNRVRIEEIQLPEQQPPAAVEPQRPAVQLPEGVTAEMVAQGEQIYGGPGTCFACHGPKGAGTPLAPALNDANWLHIDGSIDAIAGIITAGVPTPKQHPAPMPPRGGSQITDDQVRQVAAYLYTISR